MILHCGPPWSSLSQRDRRKVFEISHTFVFQFFFFFFFFPFAFLHSPFFLSLRAWSTNCSGVRPERGWETERQRDKDRGRMSEKERLRLRDYLWSVPLRRRGLGLNLHVSVFVHPSFAVPPGVEKRLPRTKDEDWLVWDGEKWHNPIKKVLNLGSTEQINLPSLLLQNVLKCNCLVITDNPHHLSMCGPLHEGKSERYCVHTTIFQAQLCSHAQLKVNKETF